MVQERRRGPDNNLSGSRLSGTRSHSLSEPPIGIESPGRDDKPVPGTCDSCKVPSKNEKLLAFRLWSVAHGTWAGQWTLCERCWLWRNDRRMDPDPLSVSEDAA